MKPLSSFALSLLLGCCLPLSVFARFAPHTPSAEDLRDPEFLAYQEKRDTEFREAQEELQRRRKSVTPEERQRLQEEWKRSSRLPLASDGYDWTTVAEQHGLDAAAREQLKRDSFLIGRREFMQGFIPYDKPKGPVFITSDALLNIYHVLFEESFRDLELARASQLRSYLEACLRGTRASIEKLPFKPQELKASWQQAQRVVGPALLLLGSSPELLDKDLLPEIEASVLCIRKSEGISLPSWLAPATPDFQGIDYSRLRPVSFYSQGSLLSDYFRAVRWLQSVPFRLGVDAEYGAITLLRLGQLASGDPAVNAFMTSLSAFVGEPDGPGLEEAPRLMDKDKSLVSKSSWHAQLELFRKKQPPMRALVREGLQAPPRDKRGELSAAFHLLNGSALPETVLFQSLIDANKPVSGLHYAAALGSPEALRLQGADARTPAFEALVRQLQPSSGSGASSEKLYVVYANTLAALFLKPDPAAPAFMGSRIWELKSIQTALSSWTQLRHSFALQTKISVLTLGAGMRPPGFIEPNPEFFHRFTALVQHTRDLFERSGAFSSESLVFMSELQSRAALCDRLLEMSRQMKYWKLRLTPEFEQFEIDSSNLIRIHSVLDLEKADYEQVNGLSKAIDAGKLTEFLPGHSAWLHQLVRDLASGKRRWHPKEGVYSDLYLTKTRWDQLHSLALRLEALLQKQLSQTDWSEQDARDLRGFGSSMAYLMGYFGNHIVPRDDAPRWVQLASFPARGTLFAAATGRPRALYVLYPWKGQLIFCEGSVLPYFEYEGRGILTDEEWTRRLNTPEAPAAPAWILPQMQPGKPELYRGVEH